MSGSLILLSSIRTLFHADVLHKKNAAHYIRAFRVRAQRATFKDLDISGNGKCIETMVYHSSFVKKHFIRNYHLLVITFKGAPT